MSSGKWRNEHVLATAEGLKALNSREMELMKLGQIAWRVFEQTAVEAPANYNLFYCCNKSRNRGVMTPG